MYQSKLDFKSKQVLEYLRKSRSDEPSMSIDEVLSKHEAILAEYTLRNFGEIIPAENTYREVASSETIDSRPEMLKLLKRIESPAIKAILVVDVQRLSRGDLEDAGRLIKLLRYTDTKIITPQRIYDIQDEYDRDNFARELKRGNEYLEYFKKIQARGRLQSVMDGNYVGSIPPYGFDKIWVKIDKKKCPTLEEKKEEADIVRLIFNQYVNENKGIKIICNELDALGIPAPKGKHWSSAAVRDMLANVHYIGKVKWNWRKEVKIVENQEIRKTRPKQKELLIFEGKHQGIVDTDTFYKAQEKLGSNPRQKPTTKIRNPFASLLYCQCGRAMILKLSNKSAPRFSCGDQAYCHTGSVLYDQLLERVCNILLDYIADFKIKLEELKNQSNNTKVQENLIRNLESKLEELDEKELRLWDKYTDEEMPKAIFDKLLDKVQSERENTKIALEKAHADTTKQKTIDYEERIASFYEAIAILDNPETDAETKNLYLKSIVRRIEYTREKPERVTRELAKQNETELHAGGMWTNPQFELKVYLKYTS